VKALVERARAEGIERISATMLAGNKPAFRIMRGFGRPFEADVLSGGVREVVARLEPLKAAPAGPIHLM
jgi:hypothetical protein